jgi:hypothetical protein
MSRDVFRWFPDFDVRRDVPPSNRWPTSAGGGKDCGIRPVGSCRIARFRTREEFPGENEGIHIFGAEDRKDTGLRRGRSRF